MDPAFLLGLTLMLLGLVGTLVPLMPGVPLMLLGAFLYSWLTAFQGLSWPWLLLLTLLTGLSLVIDITAAWWMTRRMGASRQAVAGTVLGTIAGVILFGAYGALAGGMSGAVVGDLLAGRLLIPALRSGSGAFLGFLVALAADLVIAVLMLAIYLLIAL